MGFSSVFFVPQNYAAAMMRLEATVALNHLSELGEGAIWDERTQSLLWVDIPKGELHRFNPESLDDRVFSINTEIGSVVPEEGGDVVLAVRKGFARYDTRTGNLEMIQEVQHDDSSIRFNDGKCDPAGRFWAGTLAENGKNGLGKLYCLNEASEVMVMLENVGISNGLAWSVDGSLFYYVDSMANSIFAFDYDRVSGAISSKRALITFQEGTPDGMTIDAEGMLWIALWDGGKVVRFDPFTRMVIGEVIIPGVRKVTSCAFGGKDLRTLFITTARQGFTSDDEALEPLAGSLFKIELPIRGISAYAYRHGKNH